MTNDHDRLHRYVQRYFQRRDMLEFPTVRAAAKALRMTNEDVEGAVDGDPDSRMQLTSYLTKSPTPLGDHFVEAFEP